MKTQKSFFIAAGIVFLIAAVLHLWRSVMRFDLVIGPYSIPLWVSWIVILIAGDLAWNAFRFSKK